MPFSRRRFRSATTVAFVTATVMMVGGCGGSSVEEPSANGATGADQTTTLPDSSTGTAAAPGAGTGANAVSGATDANGAAKPAAGATAGAAVPGTTQTGGAKDTGSTGTKGAAPGAASSLTQLVQRAVETQPIFGGTAACHPATGSEIRIGNVSTLSGVLGELFAPVVPALNAFVASQNACGGLVGHKIRMFISDDQDDPSTAITKVSEMVEKNKVVAMVGNIQPLTMDGITQTLKKYNMPVIGADLVSQVEMTTPLIFPQGQNVQATSYGFINATKNYFKLQKFGNLYCLEVPRPCEAAARANRELAAQMGVEVVKQLQVSITAPSYVQECLQLKSAGTQVLALNIDAASMVRIARSCTQTQFFPKTVAYPLGVGNEKQFLQGLKFLGGTYLPLNHFPWMGNSTPAEKYWQAMRTKYVPGADNGGAAALGWGAGALLVAASAGLSPTAEPTTQQLLDALYTFKGQKFTELGGLAGPRTFIKDQIPRIPYCIYPLIGNDDNTGWKSWADTATCTSTLAPSDPMAAAH
jgi:branched-chain amino acid transport system substrate-binding protein